MAAVVLLLAGLFARREVVTATPWVIAAAALLPAALIAATVLLLGRRRGMPWLALLTALLWGISVAPLAALLFNDAALQVLPHGVVTTVIGPSIEELAKTGGILVVMLAWPAALGGVRDGIVLGALAGIGFAADENLGYYTLAAVQGGVPGLARALYLRGLLEGLNHGAFTAVIGAAAGYARLRRAPRRLAVELCLGGFALAVAVHGVWNAVASEAITTVLCNAPQPGAACAPEPRMLDLLISVPLLIAIFIGPVALMLLALGLRERRSA
jgi:RsiW-degrading membrane proteinase PrsW (M82 family)